MRLPPATVARDEEVRHLSEQETLFGTGIGDLAAHLLAAAHLTHGASLWTRDRRLRAAAETLSLAAHITH